MPGFGQSPSARYSAVSSSIGAILQRLKTIVPSAGWTGTAGSGFASTPGDPARTTAKPAVHLLVPPGQAFTDELLIGVGAGANANGTLIGGVDRVRLHLEGETLDILAETAPGFPDANGNTVSYWGWWAKIAAPSNGSLNLYVEVIPANAAMQARVLGPFTFHRRSVLHDLDLTIDPQVSTSATNFHTLNAALSAVKTASAENARITFKRAMSNVSMTEQPPWGIFNPVGYVTIEAEAPVTFGYASLPTTSGVDGQVSQRAKVNGLWFRGGNITFDYARMDAVFVETGGKNHVLDSVVMTNSLGPDALYRGGPHNAGWRVAGRPYLLEVTASNIQNPGVNAALVRGGSFDDIAHDYFSNAACIVGTRAERGSDHFYNGDDPAFSVQYTGAQATATLERSGGADPNDTVYTFRWGASSATFACGRAASYYAGTAGQGYTFANLVNWINTTLAAQDAGWSATLIDTRGRRASSGSLVGTAGQGFAAQGVKTAARTVVSNFDLHGDWYQQSLSTNVENVLAYDNTGTGLQTQNIFLSSTTAARDMIFFNCALGNDTSANFPAGNVFSQLGRSGNSNTFSHVVIAHCSMPNQGLRFINNNTSFDSYCLVPNNALRGLDKAAAGSISAVVKDNHIHTGQVPLAEATGTTIGGDASSLFVDFEAGDFRPAGALLANPKAPVVARALGGKARGASAKSAAGAS